MPAPMSSEPRAGGPRPTTTRALPTRWTGSSCATTEHAVRRSRARRAPLSLLAPKRHRSILAPLRACSMPLGDGGHRAAILQVAAFPRLARRLHPAPHRAGEQGQRLSHAGQPAFGDLLWLQDDRVEAGIIN